jgi:hypothetical protein
MGRAGRRALIFIGFAAVAAIGVSTVANAGGKRVLLIGNCAKPQFKPPTLIFTCGDASFGATGVSWSAWTRKAAVGGGTGQINDCKPSCVQGKVKTAPISVRASKPQTCSNGHRVFTKLAYTWTSGAPVGNIPDHGSAPVGCKLAGL